MKFFGADFLFTALLLSASTNAFSSDLSKRALKFDNSCSTLYGSLTAKQLIDKSIDFQPKLAKAGKDGLDALIAALEFQSKVPGAKKPAVSKSELDRIIATYRVLFGDIKAKNDDGTPNPNFGKEAADHITAIKVTRDSLKRMAKPGKPDLIIHCSNDWLSEKGPKNAVPKPAAPPKAGSRYFYDMDRKRWVSVKGGKPCEGGEAAITTTNRKLTGSTREKGPERVTFCKKYLTQQKQLMNDKQPYLWDIPKAKLPDTFTTYTLEGKKEQPQRFHISAFGSKIGAKWFHQFMHTELFHPDLKKFSDKKVPDSQGGTKGIASGFNGAVGLAKQKGGKNIAETSRNIETILYWSLAMYYDEWVWSTGYPEDPETLTSSPVKAASIAERGEFKVEAAAKKGGSQKTSRSAGAEPPKTEPPPSKTEAPAEPPKTSDAAPPPPPPPPTTSAAAPPPPASSPSTQAPSSVATSVGASSVVSSLQTASITSVPSSSCSNTLCTLPSSSATSTSSEAVPQETFESEPMNAGSMTANEIIAVAGTIATEQIAAMALWDQALVEMGLPTETIEGDPTASLGTGLPMATGGMGGVGNGTWSMPVLRARQGRDGLKERRMYDYAS